MKSVRSPTCQSMVRRSPVRCCSGLTTLATQRRRDILDICHICQTVKGTKCPVTCTSAAQFGRRPASVNRGPTGQTSLLGFRGSPELRAEIVKWAERKPDQPTLSEAISAGRAGFKTVSESRHDRSGVNWCAAARPPTAGSSSPPTDPPMDR